MSLLNFPPEVTMQFIRKLNLFERINLSRARTSLSPLCFDRLLKRKSRDTLTLNELRRLYEQSETENEKDQCFKSNILDRLLIKNFNEVVRLYMDPQSKQFLANGKILHSLEWKFVLEREEEKFSADFVEQFLSLVERAEGTLLLAFDGFFSLGEYNGRRCAQILANKLRLREKVYFFNYSETMLEYEFPWPISHFMRDPFKFTICYDSFSSNDTDRSHRLRIDKRNSVENLKELTAMINRDSLLQEKQFLGKVLSLVEAEALPGGGRGLIMCANCGAHQHSSDEAMNLFIHEPEWSNCAVCALK